MWLYPVIGVVLAGLLAAAGRFSIPAGAAADELTITAADRVLIFAPHADDEVLGMGGLIYAAVRVGAPVRVVLVTNGDGFAVAARRASRQVRLTPAAYIKLAYRRQEESLQALASLGLPADCVTFFGYPDRGIAHLWLVNWEEGEPYRSRYTRLTASPYYNSYTPGAPYCGQALTGDTESVIRKFKPTQVFLPHPNDAHPDHWATYNFVRYALEMLRPEDPALFDDLTLGHYLVHQGRWPYPRGRREGAEIRPPRSLARLDTHWVEFSLSPAAVLAKYRAILTYRSQISLMFRYLVSFARKNELFALLPEPVIPAVADGQIAADGSEGDWEGIAAILADPAADTLLRRVQRSTDIDRVYLAHDTQNLYVRLDLRGRLSRFITYQLHLRLFPPPGSPLIGEREADLVIRTPGRVIFQAGRRSTPVPAGMRCRTAGRTVEAVIPLAGLGYPAKVFFGAETMLGFVHADQTAWQVAALAGAPGPP